MLVSRLDVEAAPFDLVKHLRCPRCRGGLDRTPEAYTCRLCAQRYPIVLGLADFRLYEDPLIPLEDDYRKGEKLQREAERRSFADLVAWYWTLPTFPPTPPDLSARFVRHVLTDDRRIATWQALLGGAPERTLLDVGCGAGMLLQAASRQFATAVGVDVGFRWLIVARRGLEEAGLPVNLVCACADHLPFAASVFDTVASVALLEHVPDAPAALAEFHRVQRSGGRSVVWTSNRFSVAPEPHVRVWGVGFLPRRWMPRYVKWRRGLAYDKKHLLSRFELARGLRRGGCTRIRFHLPPIVATDLESAGLVERFAARCYALVRQVPVVRWFITIVFPVLLAVGERRHRADLIA